MPDDTLVPLAVKNIDTGMGFERLCSILQGCESAYETDLFQPLLKRIEELSGHSYLGRIGSHDKDGLDGAFRIVSDHMRTVVVALADGIRFGAERKKNVRKIKELFKRAALNGTERLGMERMSMPTLVPIIIDKLGDAYPELRQRQHRIVEDVYEEEKRLWKQRDEGINHLEQMLRNHPKNSSFFPGNLVLTIVKQYRIELELVRKMAAQRGLSLDEQEFKRLYTLKTRGTESADRVQTVQFG